MKFKHKHIHSIIYIILGLFLHQASFSQQQTLKLVSDIWPPFTNVDTKKALAMDLVAEALDRADIHVNFLIEDFPMDHDCILFCHLCSNFSEAMNKELMRKAYQALEPGGLVCIYSAFMKDDETGPFRSALLSSYFLCTVNGQSRHYSWAETSSWLQDTGFINITKAKLIRNEGVLLGFKP